MNASLIKFFLLFFTFTTLAFAEQRPIRISISSVPNALNPFFSTDANSQDINRLIHLSLLDIDENMDLICIACESFYEKMEGEKQIVGFKLKKDLSFWDNTPLTSDNVKNTVAFYLDKAIGSVFKTSFHEIIDVRIKNSHHLELVYSRYDVGHIFSLLLLKIMKLKSPDLELSYENMLGAGAYVIEEKTPLAIHLKPRDTTRPPIIFKVVRDETTMALKILNKEVDLSVANISPRKYLWLKKHGGNEIKFWQKPSTNFLYMGVNHKSPTLKELKIRKALTHLLPIHDVLEHKIKGTATISTGFFSPSFKSMHQELPEYEYSKEKAEKLLAEMGYKKGDSGFFEKDGKPLTFMLKISNNKSAEELGHTFAGLLKKSGIKINVVTMEWGTFMRDIIAGRFDLMIGQWIGINGPNILKYVLYSKSAPPYGGNRGQFQNAEFDALVEKALASTDRKKIYDYYKEAQRVANKEIGTINLWHPNILWIGRPCLKNVQVYPSGSMHALLKVQNECTD